MARTRRPASLDLIDVERAGRLLRRRPHCLRRASRRAATTSARTTTPAPGASTPIRADGADLRPVTRSDQQLFPGTARFTVWQTRTETIRRHDRFFHEGYDDTDPAWLPDGRIVFTSTRWPSFAQYSGVRTTNLYVVKPTAPDCTGSRRSATAPTGRLWTRSPARSSTRAGGATIASRWTTWTTVAGPERRLPSEGRPERGPRQPGGWRATTLWRNAWHAATIKPDGTELAMWGGAFRERRGESRLRRRLHPAGDLLANFFPMYNMTEAARLRRHPPLSSAARAAAPRSSASRR